MLKPNTSSAFCTVQITARRLERQRAKGTEAASVYHRSRRGPRADIAPLYRLSYTTLLLHFPVTHQLQ